MPIQQLLADLGVLPLRAIVFQILFLLVAIALEAAVLRQRMRWGYQQSIQYAATLNLLAVCVGWLAFLILEPLVPLQAQSQIISYVLFDRFYVNGWSNNLPLVLALSGFAAFFGTLLLKLQGLKWLMILLGTAPPKQQPVQLSRAEKYEMARKGVRAKVKASETTVAVLQANALSFSVILALILLLKYIE